MVETYEKKCIFYKWRIENFDFCGQKTGESIESPLFNIESAPKTSWKLRLYPRGEEDGEYISCYLIRAAGRPAVMDVDFELSAFVGERLLMPPVFFEKIYSFENDQKEGDRLFALRRTIFLRNPAWRERCTLTIACRILKRNGEAYEVAEHFGRTLIAKECISGMDVFENVADLNSENKEDIEVKTLLNVHYPLVNINLSHFDKTITIKIYPKKCEEIKFATCKITIIKNWDKKLPIEHVCKWIGKIKTDIGRYEFLLPQAESAEQDVATNAYETFFLHYDFAYSTGVEYAINELNDYGTYLWIENISLLESSYENSKTEEPTDYLSATDALKPSYESEKFADVNIKTKTKVFKAHKALLRNRSSVLAEMLKDNPESIDLSHYAENAVQRFLLFLYSDNVEDMYHQAAIELYKMAYYYRVELLKRKCRRILEIKCHAKNVGDILQLATTCEDSRLKAYLIKYIVSHDEEVFSTDEWQFFAERSWPAAEECMLLKYKKKFFF